jgi:hypothetical protein
VADIKSRENSNPFENGWCGVFLLGSSTMGGGADDDNIGADTEAGIATGIGAFGVREGAGSCRGGSTEGIAGGGGVGA